MTQCQNCYTCAHGKLKNKAPEDKPPVLKNWCEAHNIFWDEGCSDWVESPDLIDLPGRGDSINP